jgi:hypothetical protein
MSLILLLNGRFPVHSAVQVTALERTMVDTTTRAEVDVALAQKASISDVNHTLAEISITIERSATAVRNLADAPTMHLATLYVSIAADPNSLLFLQTDLAAVQQQCEEQLQQCLQANNTCQHQIGELDHKLLIVQRSNDTKVGFSAGVVEPSAWVVVVPDSNTFFNTR